MRDALRRSSYKGGIGRCLRPGLSAPICGRWRSLRYRSYPYRLRPLARAPRCAWPPPAAVAALRAGARPFGLRHALSAAVRQPCPRCAAGRTASRTSAPALSRSPLPSSDAKRLAPLGGENYATPTCRFIVPHVLPPPTPPEAGSSAALRREGFRLAPGQGDRGSGPTSAKACEDAGQAPPGPCARTIAPTRRQAPPTPRGSVARACPKEPSHRGSAPNVKPIARRSS